MELTVASIDKCSKEQGEDFFGYVMDLDHATEVVDALKEVLTESAKLDFSDVDDSMGIFDTLYADMNAPSEEVLVTVNRVTVETLVKFGYTEDDIF